LCVGIIKVVLESQTINGINPRSAIRQQQHHISKSVVTVQRAFCAKYAKDPPTDKTIRAWYKQFTETVCLCKQKSSGHPLTAEDDV
jgi:hypothetical protein